MVVALCIGLMLSGIVVGSVQNTYQGSGGNLSG